MCWGGLLAWCESGEAGKSTLIHPLEETVTPLLTKTCNPAGVLELPTEIYIDTQAPQTLDILL